MSNVEWLKKAREAAGYPSAPFPAERSWDNLRQDYSPTHHVSDEARGKEWYEAVPDIALAFRRICAMQAKGFWLPNSIIHNPLRNPHGATGISGQGNLWDPWANPSGTLVLRHGECVAIAETPGGTYVLPGGLAEYGKDRVVPERATQTAVREAKEELGLALGQFSLRALEYFPFCAHPWDTDNAFVIDTPFHLDITASYKKPPALSPSSPEEIVRAVWVPVSELSSYRLSDYHQELVSAASADLRPAVAVIA